MSDILMVQEEPFKTADEFLTALSLRSPRWRPDPKAWAFRGNGSIDWKLVPSILRRGTWKDYLYKPDESFSFDDVTGEKNRQLLEVAEMSAVKRFMDAVDHAGLAIPEDGQDVRDIDALIEKSLSFGKPHSIGTAVPIFPPTRLLSIVAMAQHYGVPTRLLDWTWKPKVAAYFAAEWSCKNKDYPSDALAVWAINIGKMKFSWDQGPRPDELRRVQIVTAPQATNPNLAAQAGLFTLDRDAYDETCFSEAVKRRVAEGRILQPKNEIMFYKFTLPRKEAPKLMYYLALDNVSAATVYPGYKGVVESLDERKLWSVGAVAPDPNDGGGA